MPFSSVLYKGLWPDRVLYEVLTISELEGGRKWSRKITVPRSKRGKCRGAIGDYFMSKRRAWPEMEKCSKIQKSEKIRKLLMKFFLHFFRSRPDLMSK